MKTPQDPRHLKREKIIQEIFSFSFNQTKTRDETAQKIQKSIKKIDNIIKKSAPQWPIDKINKIDLAILRLAVYELIEKKEPLKVIIDEAIELAKKYGTENSPGFINGVLGDVLKKLKIYVNKQTT